MLIVHKYPECRIFPLCLHIITISLLEWFIYLVTGFASFRVIVNDSNQSMLPSIFAFNLKHSLHTIKMITMTFVKRSFLWNHKIYFFMVCSNEEHLLGIVWMLRSCAIYALILLLNARSLPWQLLLLLKYTLWFTM